VPSPLLPVCSVENLNGTIHQPSLVINLGGQLIVAKDEQPLSIFFTCQAAFLSRANRKQGLK
jgi:hypothetical protein